jgi:RHS repeat-associated protein
MHLRYGRTAFVLAVVLVSQLPAAAIGLEESTGAPVEPGATATGACASQPIVDPAMWERSLPMASESSDLSATDPRCVTEVGRSSNSVLWRNSDGTLTSRRYSSPVNYQSVDGAWRPIDTRLAADADGVVTNRGGPFNVRFGTDAAAASVVDVRHGTISFRFEGAATSSSGIDKPRQVVGEIEGNSSDSFAYANAVPGLDLRYQVLGHALKETIVLSDQFATAAAPSFRFALKLDGLEPTTAVDGTIRFVDANGAVVFAVPAGTATDASGASTGVSVKLAPSGSADDATLVESIDPSWLVDPARVFPVTIDPSLIVAAAGDGSDAYIANGAADVNTNYEGWTQLDTTLADFVDNAGVKGGETFKSLQKFDLSPFAGTDILSANWHGYALAVSGTTPVQMTLHPINAAWGSTSVTWNTQPAERTNTAASGSFAGGDWKTANITTWVQNYASGTWTDYGLEIHGPGTGRAQLASSLSTTGNVPYVDVTYDAYPTISNFSAGGQYAPGSVHWLQPTLSADLSDSDNATGLTGNFELWNAAHTGSPIYSGSSALISSDQTASWLVPANLTAGTTYSWRVSGSDGTATSAWSAWQTLKVDQTAPNTPSVSVAGVTSNGWNTSGGSTATATFGDTSSDMQGFEWGLDIGSNPTTAVEWNSGIPGATVTFSPTWGWHDLAVRAIDLAGNVSTSVQHFTFGWGLGGFSTPQTGSFTQAQVTAQANSTTSYSGMSLQWRRADTDAWADVPAGDVTFESGGAAIGSWPVTATPGTYYTSFPRLVWNASDTVSGVHGPLQLRAGFYSSSYTYLTDVASIPIVTLNQPAFGSGFASASAGPGEANLLTGNLTLSATDVSVPGGIVGRTFESRNPTAAGSVFGPGWTTNVQAGTFANISESTSGNVATVLMSDQTELSFSLATNSAYPYTYTPPAGTDMVLSKTSATAMQLTRPSSSTYVFTHQSGGSTGLYSPTQLIAPATGLTDTMTYTVASGLVQPEYTFSPIVPSISCTSATYATTAGCRTLRFDYATSTQSTSLCGSPLGDYAGRLRNVYFTSWDPDKSGGAGMHEVNVATYCYDSTGMLRTEWDPRDSAPLKTQYAYNTNGQVATLTPPGTNAWHFTYAPIGLEPAGTGRLATTYRAQLSPLGDATTSFVYAIPTSGTGAPHDMDTTTIGTWGQQDVPTTATAVFPPDQIPSGSPPSDYTRATVYYIDANARLVNVAEPLDVAHPDGYISTTEFDNNGNVTRTLTPGNRLRALAYSSIAGVQSAQAQLLDSESLYDASGVSVVDEIQPAHMVALPDGTNRLARQRTHYVYDQGAPGGATYNLVTSQTESAKPVDGSAEQDTRTTTYAYSISTDTSGWMLGRPLQTTVDPGSSPHLSLTTTTKYDTGTGQMTARILPAHPSGGDSHETDFVYYKAGSNTPSSCGGHPEWATLLCVRQPAAQPGTSGLPNLPANQVTKYSMYGRVETSTDTNGTDNRTTTIGYDATGRPTTQHVTGTSSAGTALPTITATYDTSTGMPYETTDGTLTISRTYDALGRLHTYQDADGNTSTYAYDLLDRRSTLNDGKGTATYTYNDVGTEERGLPTTINYGGVGSFTATYDADGNLATQSSPGAFTATYTHDEVGEVTGIAYTKGTSWWPASTGRYNIHGEQTHASASTESYSYTYDAAARLIQATNVGLLSCPEQRVYQFDADTNRTQLQETVGCTGAQTITTKNSSYDAADRITASGYIYDKFGRTTTVPASDGSTGHVSTASYYANDLVRQIANNGVTNTHNLDPNERLRTFVSSSNSLVHTNHYTADNDSPAWTSEVTAGTTWNRWLQGFNGMAATVNQVGAITVDFVNVHGDAFSTVASTATSVSDPSYTGTFTDEYGVPQGSTARYDYLGADQRKRDVNSGLQLMGQRVYNPSSGRFLQTDPIPGGGANAYAYCSGDPVNCRDLAGLTDNQDLAVAQYTCAGNGPFDAECVDRWLSQHAHSASLRRKAAVHMYVYHDSRERQLAFFYLAVVLMEAYGRTSLYAIATAACFEAASALKPFCAPMKFWITHGYMPWDHSLGYEYFHSVGGAMKVS